MNNHEVMAPVRRFSWPKKNVDQTHTEMRVAFAEDGYLICDGFATTKECAEMIAQVDKLIAAFDETADQVVFSASVQSHAATDYFMDSASQISCFLEAGAVDEAGCLIKPKMQAVNKIGHALHDLDPVFSRFSRQDKCADMVRLLGLNNPLLLQSMVICKQPFIGVRSTAIRIQPFYIPRRIAASGCGSLWSRQPPPMAVCGLHVAAIPRR